MVKPAGQIVLMACQFARCPFNVDFSVLIPIKVDTQGLASGTSPLVCTHISSRRDQIFGPCK